MSEFYSTKRTDPTVKPEIEVTAYNTPLTNFQSLFGAGVLNLDKEEVALLRIFAGQLNALRRDPSPPDVIMVPIKRKITNGSYADTAGAPPKANITESFVKGRGQITNLPEQPPPLNSRDWDSYGWDEPNAPEAKNFERGSTTIDPETDELWNLPESPTPDFPINVITDRDPKSNTIKQRIVPRFVCMNGHPLPNGTAWCTRCEKSKGIYGSAKERKERETTLAELKEKKKNDASNNAPTNRFGGLDL